MSLEKLEAKTTGSTDVL